MECIAERLDLIGSGYLEVGFFELLNGEINILEAHSWRILNVRLSIRIPDTGGFGRVVGSLSQGALHTFWKRIIGHSLEGAKLCEQIVFFETTV
jgi:hypothetical protein